MIAPACPIRLPVGAVTPAMKAATGFFMLALDPVCSILFRTATDLADHEDRFSVRILVEKIEAVDEFHAADWVAADADAG